MRRSTCLALQGLAAAAMGCGSQMVRGPDGVVVDASFLEDARDAAADVRAVDEPAYPADVTRVAEGATCPDAIPVAVNSTYEVVAPEPVDAPPARYSGAEILAGSFPVRWIRVRVPPRTRVEVRNRSEGAGLGYTMFGFTGCAERDLAAAPAHELEGSDPRVEWPAASDTPQDFYVALIGSPPPTRQNTVSVTSFPIEANGYCASARAVIDGTALPAQDLRYAGERAGSCAPPSAPLSMHPALYYRTRVNSGETLFASARYTTPGLPRLLARLNVRDACGDAACLAQSAWNLDGWRRAGVAWTNDGPARDVWIAFDDRVGAQADTPTLTFRVAATSPNARCEEALPLAFGASRDANLATAARTELPCVAPTSQQAAYYAVSVPARSTLSVTAEAVEGLDDGVAVQVLDGCARPTCLAHASRAVGPSVTATWVNRSEATGVIVAVTGANPLGRARSLARVTARILP